MDDQLKPQKESAAGVKYDKDKLRYDLISPAALEGLVKILTFGANKYAARNWEKGITYSRVFGALMRHLWAWWRGEHNDPETGESHLHHAACCIMFLQHYESDAVNYVECDDRPSTLALFAEKDKYAHAINAGKLRDSIEAKVEFRDVMWQQDAFGKFVRCPGCGNKEYPLKLGLKIPTSLICPQCGSLLTLAN